MLPSLELWYVASIAKNADQHNSYAGLENHNNIYADFLLNFKTWLWHF